MKDREYLFSNYGDLLPADGDPDPKLLRLVRDLDAIATKNPPATLAASIESVLQMRQRQFALKGLNRIDAAAPRAAGTDWLPAIKGQRRIWRPSARVGLVAIMATFLFSLGVTIYAVAFLAGGQREVTVPLRVFAVPSLTSSTPIPSPVASPLTTIFPRHL